MPSTIRFEHEFISELGLFQITSPDIKGFYITAPTQGEAEREALTMLALIRSQSEPVARKLASVTLATA